MALYADLNLINAYIEGDGDLVQGSKTYAFKQFGGGLNPIIFPHEYFNRIRLSANSSTEDRDRSEILVSAGVAHAKTYHMGFNLYIPYGEGYPFPDNWFIMMQLRQNGAGSHSPGLSLDLATTGSNWFLSLVARGDGGYKKLFSQKLNGSGNDWFFNRWFNVIIKFELHEEGRAQIFIDRPWGGAGISSNEYTHNMLNSTLVSNYSSLKFGVYRGQTSSTNTYFVNFSNFRLGDWYSEVKSW